MNFKLRPFVIEDLPSLVKHANNPKIAGNLTNRFAHPYTEENGRMFIEFANAEKPTNLFAIEVNGEAAGGIGLHTQPDIFCKNMGMGYWLGETHWGKGIVTAAINQMVKYGFETWDITRIFARPFGSNIVSQHVLEKAGFTLEAKFEKTLFKNDKVEDEWIYGIRKS